MPTFNSGSTVSVVRRTVTGTDDYGNDVFGTVTTIYWNVPVWQTGSTETTQGADSVISDLSALLPPGANVAAIDKVQIDGNDYEVTGRPWAPKSPFTGSAPGVVVELKSVTG